MAGAGRAGEDEELYRDILQRVDLNENGKIDYSEFLVAAADRDALLRPENVRYVFDRIDAARSGYVSRG